MKTTACSRLFLFLVGLPCARGLLPPRRVISFDLDDTVWPIKPVVESANAAVAREFGPVLAADAVSLRIDAVDESTIMRVASEYVFDREMAVSSMGPVGYLPDYNWMRRRTYWTRF